jgi:hypothetical protein
VPEDVDFDPEEAFLTQLLLWNLDAYTAASASASVPVPQSGAGLGAPMRPVATHRFTQDSTSTGQTLCESEVFKLARGSVSTEVGSTCVSACMSACASVGSESQLVSPVSTQA